MGDNTRKMGSVPVIIIGMTVTIHKIISISIILVSIIIIVIIIRAFIYIVFFFCLFIFPKFCVPQIGGLQIIIRGHVFGFIFRNF